MDELVGDYWLLIEGPFRKGPGGELQVHHSWKTGTWVDVSLGNRGFNYSDLETWCITMQTLTPLKIKITQSRQETRDWIMTLHGWWERGKEKHRSHMVTDRSKETIQLIKASLLRRFAEQLPGVGHNKALKVEQYFADVMEACMATEEQWQEIEGIGEKMAGRIVEAINGREG